MIQVVLPVLDEAEAIPGVLAGMPEGYSPIVVDNGSTDGSGDLARSLGADVVTETMAGYGAAVAAGLDHATAEIVCVMDCDGSLDPAELLDLVGVLEGESVDMVLGRRVHEDGAWPLHARLANRYLASQVRRRSGLQVTDIGPMRVARRSRVLDLGVTDRRFGYPLELLLRAGQAGWRVAERPVAYRPRIGRSKVTGSLRGTVRAARDMRRVLQ